jgi:hypothetical protein
MLHHRARNRYLNLDLPSLDKSNVDYIISRSSFDLLPTYTTYPLLFS